MSYFFDGPHRTYCDALDELRKYIPTVISKQNQIDFALSLIEELQTYGNRMESALYTKKDYFELQRECKRLRKRRSNLKRFIEDKAKEHDVELDDDQNPIKKPKRDTRQPYGGG